MKKNGVQFKRRDRNLKARVNDYEHAVIEFGKACSGSEMTTAEFMRVAALRYAQELSRGLSPQGSGLL